MFTRTIPDICHERRSCKFFLAGVNFYRFNAKIGNLLCKLAIYSANFGANFIFQKFCLCKKMTNMRYGQCVLLPPLPNLLLTFRQFIFNQFRDPCPGLSEKVVRSLPGSNLIFNLRLSTLGGKLNKQKGEDNCTSISFCCRINEKP